MDSHDKPEEQKQSEIVEQQPNALDDADVPDILHVTIEDGKPTPDIESMCMYCHGQGVTRFMQVTIPFFKQIMISAFSCELCGYKNSEVQFTGQLGDYGEKFEVNVINGVAFNRTVVKSDYATIRVPEAGLEIPPEAQKGSIKTIEGYFRATIEGLQGLQEERRKYDPITAEKIDEYCVKLERFANMEEMPFTFIVEDPSGNSFVQNPSAPTADQYCKKTKWMRSAEEYEALGYPVDQAVLSAQNDQMRLQEKSTEQVKQMMTNINNKVSQSKEEQDALLAKAKSYAVKTEANAVAKAGYVDFSRSVEDQQQLDGVDEKDRDVLVLPTPCYVCTKMGSVQMCTSSIPFFKEIIIMAFVCDHCGYRNSEIKEGGGIGEKAKRITFRVSEPEDLCRDLFKSDTAKFTIKELDFDMDAGSMGSLYTTAEGLLAKLIDELEKNNPFGRGDSKTDNSFLKFIDQLKQYKEGKEPFTLILDDAADNCFIYNPIAPADDPKITIEVYERTPEQNDDLGILHMKTENYTQEFLAE